MLRPTSQSLNVVLTRQVSCRRLLHFKSPRESRQLQPNSSWLPIPSHAQSSFSSARLTSLRGFQSGGGSNKSRHINQPPDERQEYRFEAPKVRYAGPAAWATIVSAGIFISLAYMEAKEQLKPAPSGLRLPAVLEHYRPQRSSKTPTEVAQQWWRDQDTISKTTIGIMGVNSAVHLTRFALPTLWSSLWHIPAKPVNYSLFTSMFVHSGGFHLAFNMWACYNFVPPVGHSTLFEGSPYHTLSFFLSAGVLSGYGQHLSTLFARPPYSGLIPSGGASGALFGMFAAFCMQYPQAKIGVILLPFSFDAQSFLPCVMLFDFLGMVGLYNLGLGHGAHLAGALLGLGYSYFDGKNKIWIPLVEFWTRRLKRGSS